MLASNEWETLGDISRRTGVRGEEVIENVRAAFWAKQVECKFDEVEGVTITLVRRKDAENGK